MGRKRPRRAGSPAAAAFQCWLGQHRVRMDGVAIREAQDGRSGDCLVATRPLQPGHVLFRVPSDACITAEVALGSPVGAAIRAHVRVVPTAEEAEEGRPACTEASVLQAFLIHQRFVEQPEDGFAPYVRHLPHHFSTPLTWDAAALKRWPAEAFDLAGETQALRQHLRRQYALLFPCLSRHAPALFPPTAFTWRHWLWAFLAYSTRALPRHCVGRGRAVRGSPEGGRGDPDLAEVDDDGRVGALVPVYDMTNHHPEGAHFVWRNQCAILQHPLAEGEEVLNNYGPKSNRALLTSFGFCRWENPEEKVAVPLPPLTTCAEACCAGAADCRPACSTAAAIALRSGVATIAHISHDRPVPAALLQAARAWCVTSAEARRRPDVRRAVSPAAEARALQLVKHWLWRRAEALLEGQSVAYWQAVVDGVKAAHCVAVGDGEYCTAPAAAAAAYRGAQLCVLVAALNRVIRLQQDHRTANA